MDDESSESTEEDTVTGLGECQIERLGWRWRVKAGSWFQRHTKGAISYA